MDAYLNPVGSMSFCRIRIPRLLIRSVTGFIHKKSVWPLKSFTFSGKIHCPTIRYRTYWYLIHYKCLRMLCKSCWEKPIQIKNLIQIGTKMLPKHNTAYNFTILQHWLNFDGTGTGYHNYLVIPNLTWMYLDEDLRKARGMGSLKMVVRYGGGGGGAQKQRSTPTPG